MRTILQKSLIAFALLLIVVGAEDYVPLNDGSFFYT